MKVHKSKTGYLPPTTILNLILIYQVQLASDKCTKKKFPSLKMTFSKAKLPPGNKDFAESNLIMHTIVSPLLFKYLNVFRINIWEKGQTKTP